MNCLALEQGDDVFVVDCGIRFPWDELGVDVVRPDFTWLEQRAARVRGVFLTHGHEDHIGALPYLLRKVPVPIWGPPHALGLVRRRLVEHDFGPNDVDLREAFPGNRYALGSFVIEPVRVAHSIVEASALRISTDAGTILHTGDFNFDPDPPDGEPTDEMRLAEIADEGVGLLLSDSTNIDVPAKGGSEKGVGAALEAIVEGASARVFVALFASNIQRLLMLGDIALRSGRKICALGRSLDTQIAVATEIGRLKWPSNLRIRPDEARTMPRDRLLVLAGGTQGEPASAMSRLAANTHQELSIEPGDTVVFSSRAIPGNERAVFDTVASVMRRGAVVITRVTNPDVHTSGHATRAEQTRMIELLRPRCFLPVHGTLHHLTRHGALARELGVRDVAVVENGTAVLFDGESVRVEGRVPSGTISVGFGAVDLDGDTLRERAELARYGLASVAFAVDRKGNLVGSPSIFLRGIAGKPDAASLRPLERSIVSTIESARKRKASRQELRDEVRRVVRRFVADLGGTRPVVEVHLIEQEG
jgi:ribonuclease J